MDTFCSVGIVLVSVILGTTGDSDYGSVQRSLDVLKHVERARLYRRDVPGADELNIAITRLIKREAIKHNHFQHLKNIHLALMRRKRGWINDDITNRATEIPTSTISTPQTPPEPVDTIVPGVTNTTTSLPTTSPATTTIATPTITYKVNTTDSSFTTMSTTESSSTNMLPYLLNHVVAIVIVLIF